MSFLWVACYVLLALFLAAVVVRTISRLAGRATPPPYRRAAGEVNSARDAYADAAPGEHVIGWRLDPQDRSRLLAQLPPKYDAVVADHVTLKSHVAADAALPPETQAAIIGRSDDGRGVEAMVVRLGDTTERPDGGTYHVTWSLAPGRQAQESNQVIAAQGWQPIDPPIAIRLQAESFPRSGKAPSLATAN